MYIIGWPVTEEPYMLDALCNWYVSYCTLKIYTAMFGCSKGALFEYDGEAKEERYIIL